MVVTKINKSEREDELRSTIELTFESNLVMMKTSTDRRIISGHNIPDLIELTCERTGLNKNPLRFNLSHAYPIKPHTLQANKTDGAFVRQLTAPATIILTGAQGRDDCSEA